MSHLRFYRFFENSIVSLFLMKIEKSASNNDVGIIAKILLFCATPCFEVLTKFLEYQLKANMIKTILKDYHWLRQQIHLP